MAFINRLENESYKDWDYAKPRYYEAVLSTVRKRMSIKYKEQKVSNKISIKLTSLANRILSSQIQGTLYPEFKKMWTIKWIIAKSNFKWET